MPLRRLRRLRSFAKITRVLRSYYFSLVLRFVQTVIPSLAGFRSECIIFSSLFSHSRRSYPRHLLKALRRTNNTSRSRPLTRTSTQPVARGMLRQLAFSSLSVTSGSACSMRLYHATSLTDDAGCGLNWQNGVSYGGRLYAGVPLYPYSSS